jgi:hypothetical protein
MLDFRALALEGNSQSLRRCPMKLREHLDRRDGF